MKLSILKRFLLHIDETLERTECALLRDMEDIPTARHETQIARNLLRFVRDELELEEE